MIQNRRNFLRELGLSAAALPFVAGLPSLQAADAVARRQRLIIIFSPNGTLPPHFWQDEPGPLGELKAILQPLAEFKDRMLMLKGLHNRIRGDGDQHQRGLAERRHAQHGVAAGLHRLDAGLGLGVGAAHRLSF